MKKPVVVILLIVILLAALGGGWWWYQSSRQQPLTLYGNVDIRTVNMSFRVGGRLASLTVDEGDSIRAGQTLGELDRAPYENALLQAQANVSTAQAQYDLMMAGYRAEEIAQAAAAVKQAQAAYDYAQNFYQRQLGLRASSAISANDLENARSSRDQAQATLKSAQDKLRQYRAGNRPQEIAQAKASLEQAQAALAQAKLDLHDTVLTAPSDGTLMTRAVEPGTMLNAGGTVLTLSLTHPVWVRAYVDEKNLGQAQPGREVLLYTDSRPDKPYHGKIGFVSPSAEFTPKTVETPDLRTDLVYRLRIVVNDADGAGKTTLMRMLAGLLKPDEGRASVIGFDPLKDDSALHAVLGYMPQKFGLYEDLTVMENLTLYADLRSVTGEARKKIFDRLLEFTSLGPFTERLAGKLSGGMKQKLGLACTLVGDPKVLLLDEPGVGVDPISRRELWQMVHELAGDGMLILWSTSYLDEAEQCRDVLLMNEGKLLYQGEPTALTQTMAGRSFLVSSPQENNRRLLQRALKLPQVSDGVIQGKSVRLILKKDARIEEVQQHGDMPPLQVADTAPRFEDAFIDLLGGAGTAESPLGAIIHRVDGSKDETVIEAQSLTKKFGDFAATDHVDFQVKRGEIFGLLGPNGAGKSTTFKMMCGLLVPTSGKALVLGMDLKVSSGKARQHLGYMAQKFSLYGNLSVEQNLRFFSGVYGLRGRAQNEKIARMSDAFGLKSIARHAADELPLGYKQRLALACSLMHEPDILFLDEPTSGVDPLTRREFWLHINSMVDKGVTVMVTTHFMDEAEYCDRIGLVYHGKLIASGTPDALKAQAADDSQTDPTMEQAFITLINRWDKENSHEQ